MEPDEISERNEEPSLPKDQPPSHWSGPQRKGKPKKNKKKSEETLHGIAAKGTTVLLPVRDIEHLCRKRRKGHRRREEDLFDVVVKNRMSKPLRVRGDA